MPLLELQLKHPENLIPDFLEFTRKCSFFAKFSSRIQSVTFVRLEARNGQNEFHENPFCAAVK